MQKRTIAAAPFPTTQWTLVHRAGTAGPEGRRALAELLRRYLGPLRAHLARRWRLAGDRIDDTLQAFVSAQVLEKDLIARAERERGKFRTYLLLALDRFVSSQLRHESRARRRPDGPGGPNGPNGPNGLAGANDAGLAGAVDPAPPPDEAFELSWARQVLVYAARRMRDACRQAGRADAWVVFEARVLGPTLEGGDAVAFEQLADRLGLASAQQASNLLVTARRMFARSLRDVIGEYVGDEAAIEAEVADLRQILGRRRGR